LIVYAIREGSKNRLSLNPLLKKILSPFAADSTILFPYAAEYSAVDSGQSANSGFNDIFLAAFLTFITPETHISKNDGTLRKNLLQKIQKIFPSGADIFATALRHIGILTEGLFDYMGQKLQDFVGLTEAERFAYCAAGVYISLNSGNMEIFSLQKNLLRHIAVTVSALFMLLDQDKCYPVSTLKRIIAAILTVPADERTGYAALKNIQAVNEPLKSAVLFDAMEKTGLLLKVREGYCKRTIIHGGSSENVPVIAFNSGFSFILLPEISFRSAVSLAPFCEVVEAKPSVQFKLTQKSVVRGFNSGINSKTMFKLLMEFSCGRIDSGLEEVLDDWQKRHSEVVILEGISIVLSEERRYIVQTEPLASHIVFSPLPGVYLLDIAERNEAAAILRNAGIDIISEPQIRTRQDGSFQKRASSFFSSITTQTAALTEKFEVEISAPYTRTTSISMNGRSYQYAEEYKKHFRAVLDGLKPSQMEREELAFRIERRLIISQRQLSGAFIRYEKREVHGLDYAGKLALVKQAIISSETLEIIVQDSDGSEKYIRGIPLMLEKMENEITLSLKLPQADMLGKFDTYTELSGCIKIPMGKIRMIRRIKQSIFSN
jgi:hypothetical protein